MPRITFVGEPAQAPTGYAIWQPGEEREVTERQAQELERNVNYVRTGDAAPAGPAAPEAPPVPRSPFVAPRPAQPEVQDAPPAAQGG